MAKTRESASHFVRQMRFVGRGGGAVKNLRGFKKSHHTLPDAVNAATSGFLAKLCNEELAEEAEGFFQKARAVFAYKRKDSSLDVATPTAVLTTKDFTLELTYALDEKEPDEFIITRSLHSAHSSDFFGTPECAALFAGLFTEVVFALTKGARVEAVIDAVEGLADSALEVSYPSDCSHCLLSVEGVSAEVRFDGSELAMVFPRGAAPGELLEAFLRVREAFKLSEDPELAGLVK